MDDTKELIARLNAMKDSLQVCVNHVATDLMPLAASKLDVTFCTETVTSLQPT